MKRRAYLIMTLVILFPGGVVGCRGMECVDHLTGNQLHWGPCTGQERVSQPGAGFVYPPYYAPTPYHPHYPGYPYYGQGYAERRAFEEGY